MIWTRMATLDISGIKTLGCCHKTNTFSWMLPLAIHVRGLLDATVYCSCGMTRGCSIRQRTMALGSLHVQRNIYLQTQHIWIDTNSKGVCKQMCKRNGESMAPNGEIMAANSEIMTPHDEMVAEQSLLR